MVPVPRASLPTMCQVVDLVLVKNSLRKHLSALMELALHRQMRCGQEAFHTGCNKNGNARGALGLSGRVKAKKDMEAEPKSGKWR